MKLPFIAKLLRLPLILSVLMVVFCASALAPLKTVSPRNILLADPSLFYHKGTYYLYGTGSPSNEGFAVYTSVDLKTWKGPAGVTDGYALKKGDAYGDAGFWAPQVFMYNNRFYMAYTANERIGIAVSHSPLGPFKQEVLQPLAAGTKQIDPYVFINDDGKKYLYYVVVANGGNRIFVAEMNEDMLSVKKETARLCIEADQPWENADTNYAKWTVTEGPSVVKHKNSYYLIYSANHFRSAYYAVGYAVSPSPLGPWKKCEDSPIIRKEVTGQNGSGHGDLIEGANGEWLYVFHTHFSNNKIAPRKTAMMKAGFATDKKTGIDQLMIQPGTFRYLYTNE